MGFPAEKVIIKEIISYTPAGIGITDIYPSGEYKNIVDNKSGYLYLIPELESPALEVYDNPSRLANGKFTLVSTASPNIGQVYVNPTTGDYQFNQFEDAQEVWFFYTGYGTLVGAETYYNKVREALHDIQDHLLTASGQRLEDIELAASGLYNEVIAISGYLQSDVNNVWVHSSGVNTALIAASGTLNNRITSVRNEIVGISSYLQSSLAISYINSIGYTDAVASGLSLGLVSASGYLQGQIDDYGSGLVDLDDKIVATSGSIVSYVDITASGLNSQIVDSSGRLDAHIAADNPHGLTYADVGASPSGHTHNDLYYTQTELDILFTEVSNSGLVDDTMFTDASGYLQNQITANYNNIVNVSGYLLGEMDSQIAMASGYLSSLIDSEILVASGYLQGLIEDNASNTISVSGYLQSQVLINASGVLGISGDLSTHIGLTNNPHSVTLEQVRSQNNQVAGSIDMDGNSIFGLPEPSGATDAVSKSYVDALAISNGMAWQEPVLMTTTTPPGSPSEGDRYIINSGATGVWTGLQTQIAEWSNSAWVYAIPEDGWVVLNNDNNRFLTFNGAAWVYIGNMMDHGALGGLADDDHPQYYNAARLSTYLDSWDNEIWLAITAASGRIDANESGISDHTSWIAAISGVAAQNTVDIAGVSGLLGNYLPLAGGIMEGDINFSGNNITNIGNINGGVPWTQANDEDILFANRDDVITSKFHFASGVFFNADLDNYIKSNGTESIAFYIDNTYKANVSNTAFSGSVTLGAVAAKWSEAWIEKLIVAEDAPATSGSAGYSHEIRVDDNFVYFKGTDGWLKIQGTLMPPS